MRESNLFDRRFAVVVSDPTTTFNAAHFVAFPLSKGAERWLGESPHNHDFRVVVRVEGPLDASGCVVDFLAARRAAREVAAGWDNRLFLARKTPCAEYVERKNDAGLLETEVRWNGEPAPRRWVFPSKTVVWLDSVNASAEAIADAFLDRWLERIFAANALAFPMERYDFALRLTEAPGCVVEVVRATKIK